MRVPFGLIAQVRLLQRTLGLALLAGMISSAFSRDIQIQVGATIALEVALAAGDSARITSLPTVIAVRGDPSQSGKLQQLFSDIGPDWLNSENADFKTGFPQWLSKRLVDLGFRAVSNTPPALNGAAKVEWSIVANVIPNAEITAFLIVVPTSALSKNNSPTEVPAGELVPGRSATNSTAAATALFNATRVRLISNQQEIGSVGETGNARGQIQQIAGFAANVVCEEYAEPQNRARYRPATNSRILAEIHRVLGENVVADVNYFTTLPGENAPLPPGTLAVQITGLDPVLTTTAHVTEVDMPAEGGGRMGLDAFKTRYGKTALGRRVLSQVESLEKTLRERLETLIPRASLPQFVPEETEARVTSELTRFPGALAIQSTHDAGLLAFACVFRPPQGVLQISLDGDSSRELTGSASFDYSPNWQKDDRLSAAASLGLQNASASAGYTVPLSLGYSNAWSADFAVESAYDRTDDVRLGTFSGPLATLSDTTADAKLTVSRDFGPNRSASPSLPPSRPFHFSAFLSAGVRRLRGSAPDDFLGQPQKVSGGAVNAQFNLQHETRKALSEADNSRRSPLRNVVTSLKVDASQLFTHDGEDYTRLSGEFASRAEFGGGDREVGYVEGRLSAGWGSDSMPRIDFFRLGDDALRGLEEGELAGRSFATVALEGGPNLGALIRRLSSKKQDQLPPKADAEDATAAQEPASPLDQFFAFALVEHGWVSRQENAGPNFNSRTQATSFALGTRYFGEVPGLSGGASISFGYAWSPHSLRSSGRFFTAVSISFGK